MSGVQGTNDQPTDPKLEKPHSLRGMPHCTGECWLLFLVRMKMRTVIGDERVFKSLHYCI